LLTVPTVSVGSAMGRCPAGGVHATVVGDESADRTPSGLWPSDHAGVVASLTLSRQKLQP